MNKSRALRGRSDRPASEEGFTLIELLISITILAVITGTLAGVFATSMTAHNNNSQMVHASNDAQLISAFLIRDGQSAGGTNPITGLIDGTLGVSVNWVAENAPGGDPDPLVCTEPSPQQLLIRFAWRDNVDADLNNSHLHLAKYYFVPASGSTEGQIVRLTCVDSTHESELTLGTHVGTPAPVATCVLSGACPGLPDLVRLAVNEVPNTLTPGTPYSYTLTANVRASNDVPTLGSGNAATVPLLALGDGNCSHGASYAQGGNGTARVYGGAAVGGTACDPFNFFGSYSYTAAGDPQQQPILDPYRFLPTPAGTCPASGGVNPGLDANNMYPPGVYPQALPADASLEPGVFVLCADVPTGLTGLGVMLYLAQGKLQWNGNAASLTNLTAPSSGPYAGIAIWQPKDNTADLSINGGAGLTLGLAAPGMGSGIYAPKALVGLTGTANISVGWIVAQTVLVTGDHTVTVGVPPATLPSIDAAPATLPTGLVGDQYGPMQITATGGPGGNTWTDKDPATQLHTLPPGLSINSLTGVISGTPTAPCTCIAVITVMDNLGDVSRKSYPLTIDALPSVTSTNPSSRGQGATNQNITINGSDFVNGAVASFSGAGITVNSTTWVNATKLTANIDVAGGATTGARNVTVTNPDTGVGSGIGVFTVNAAPTVTSTNPSSRGRGASNQNVTINGTNFVNGAIASFSIAGITVNSTTWVSATQLTANIKIAGGPGTGFGDVTVTNPDGGVGTGSSVFTVNGGPTITTPDSGVPVSITHSTTGSFTITGSGFVNGVGLVVTISGGFTVNSATFVDSGHLTVNVTAGNNGQTGTYNVTVTNPDGGSVTSVNSIVNV